MINGEKMLYRIEKDDITLLDETTLPSEEILENHLEDWVEQESDILGEPLLIIGRQVQIGDVKDTLDLLAVDKNGHLVVIELKRDRTGRDVDFQALKYVSYISRWGYDNINKQAENYFQQYLNKNDFNLVEELENFCEKDYELNGEQRIIIVGRKIDKKIGSVALWLLDHKISMKVVEVTPYKDNDNIYLYPKIIIPPPTTELFELGKGTKEKPWLGDGKEWHLNQRCGGSDIIEKLLCIFDAISQISGVDGPKLNQRYYISFVIKNKIWIKIVTHVSFLNVFIHSERGKFSDDDLSSMLNIAKFEQEASLSGKLRTKSAIGINTSSNVDEIQLLVKDDFDYSTKEFESFITETRDSFFKMR